MASHSVRNMAFYDQNISRVNRVCTPKGFINSIRVLKLIDNRLSPFFHRTVAFPLDSTVLVSVRKIHEGKSGTFLDLLI